MRLWHEALIPYLPRQQLLGQHRECCALRGNGWGKPHSVVNYVFQHSEGWLFAYHLKVMDEMKRRGYNVTPEWYDYDYRGRALGYMAEDWRLIVIMDLNSLSEDLKNRKYIYPEHDAAYLQECLDNLASKGIHINMEESR